MIVTLSFAEASRQTDRQTTVSEVRPVQCGRMPRAAGTQAVRTIGRDTQYETGLKGWRMPPLTSLHLIVYIACVAQRNSKMSLGFTPGG